MSAAIPLRAIQAIALQYPGRGAAKTGAQGRHAALGRNTGAEAFNGASGEGTGRRAAARAGERRSHASRGAIVEGEEGLLHKQRKRDRGCGQGMGGNNGYRIEAGK